MAFHDNPQVDGSAERSEISVLHTSQMFLLKAGFIRREEKPDYGVDLNVELVSDRGATGNLFAVQIKSAERIRTITQTAFNVKGNSLQLPSSVRDLK